MITNHSTILFLYEILEEEKSEEDGIASFIVLENLFSLNVKKNGDEE